VLALSKSKANLNIVTTSPPPSKLGQSYQTALGLITQFTLERTSCNCQLIQSIWHNGRTSAVFWSSLWPKTGPRRALIRHQVSDRHGLTLPNSDRRPYDFFSLVWVPSIDLKFPWRDTWCKMNESRLQQPRVMISCTSVTCFTVNFQVILKTWAARNFACYDSLVIFFPRSGKKSPSLSLAPFLAGSRFRFGVYCKHTTTFSVNVVNLWAILCPTLHSCPTLYTVVVRYAWNIQYCAFDTATYPGLPNARICHNLDPIRTSGIHSEP